MGNLRCPKCGSIDCKTKEITLDKIGYFAADLIGDLISGKNRALDNARRREYYNNGSGKKTYKCRSCGYVWESR